MEPITTLYMAERITTLVENIDTASLIRLYNFLFDEEVTIDNVEVN